jgi:coenzyme PQQ precursor peptide PqqA
MRMAGERALSKIRDRFREEWLDGCLSAVTSLYRYLGLPEERSSQDTEGNDAMAWSTPEVREVCVGMEVTSYLSAEM